MIDYEKLNLAHELADKYEQKGSGHVSITVQYRNIEGNPIFELRHFELKPEFQIIDHIQNSYWNIDDLIAKLQELTKPEPKYKSGQTWWLLVEDNEIRSIKLSDDNIEFYCVNKAALIDAFPTRQALIEHQIEYWNNLNCKDGYHDFGETDYTCDICRWCVAGNSKPDTQCSQPHVDVDRCEHDWSQPIDRGDPYHPVDRFFIRCGKCYEEKTVCVPIPKCQHEYDGKEPPKLSHFTAEEGCVFVNKCVKCGEFYR